MKINWLRIIAILTVIFNLLWPLATSHKLLAAGSTDLEEYQKYGTHNIKWDDYVKAGMNAFDSGNLAGSEMFFQRAIARGCDDALLYVKIGLYNEAQSNYKKAIDYFKKASKKLSAQYPKHEYNSAINEMMGRSLYMLGQKEEAAAYLQKAAEKGDNFTALYLLGQIANEKKDSDNAVKYLESAFKAKRPEGFDPKINILIMTELGKAYYDRKDYATSTAWWDKILAVDPENRIANSYKEEIKRMKFKEEERKILESIVQ